MGEIITEGSLIDGVKLFPLKQIKDDRGMVMHMLRSDDPWFENMGEIYFSTVKPGVVKAWKRHLKMTQFYAVPVGLIKLVIYDDREGSCTKGVIQEIRSGVDHYGLIRIPPLVWYGFSGCASEEALIVNCATLPHDATEVQRLDLDAPQIPYEW